MYYTIQENYTTGYIDVSLYLVYMLSILLGIYIIISKNPIVSVLFLIGLFFSISVYLIMTGLYFIGLSYMLVYVGAISILFLFILMLINIRVSELITDNNNSIALATISLVCFNYITSNFLSIVVLNYDDPNSFNLFSHVYRNIYKNVLNNMELNDIIFALFNQIEEFALINIEYKTWELIYLTVSNITSIGNILYTNLLVDFIIVSKILLLAMAGTIIITTIDRSNTK